MRAKAPSCVALGIGVPETGWGYLQAAKLSAMEFSFTFAVWGWFHCIQACSARYHPAGESRRGWPRYGSSCVC